MPFQHGVVEVSEKCYDLALALIDNHTFFRIYTLTWNTNAQYAPQELDCTNLLGLAGKSIDEAPDIYCLG